MENFSIPGVAAALSLPAIVAPMFLVSGPQLVSAACKSGVIGSFPSINARTPEQFHNWLDDIETELAIARRATPDAPIAPYAVNLIMHPSNSRRDPDLQIIVRHKVSLVIASVGNPAAAVDAVHAYGGRVLCDVATVKHARKAVEAGVDGLILLCGGAGGHTGWINPFAFLPEVRSFFNGPILLAGSIANGHSIRAVRQLGADGVYMGTRFLAATESMASTAYKEGLVNGSADDVVLTTAVSGLPGNFLRESLKHNGINATRPLTSDFQIPSGKRWLDIWSAGHAVGAVHAIEPVAEIVRRLVREFHHTSGLQPYTQ